MSTEIASATAIETEKEEGPTAEKNDRPTIEDNVAAVVLRDLRRFLSPSSSSGAASSSSSGSLFDKSATAVPVAAIKALLEVVQRSRAETMMGLQDELQTAAKCMTENYHTIYYASSGENHNPTRISSSHIALQSGIELFLKYVTRTFLESPSFEECRQSVLERGARFQSMSLAARDRIVANSSSFIRMNCTVLTHGWSRVVAAILLEASKTKHFNVIILHGGQDASGVKAAQFYARETNIPVTVVVDAAMGYIMEEVDMVLIGAEGVLENGGIVNKLGTYALAACASALGKPLYVAAESYKFARLYPLHQRDLPNHHPESFSFVDSTTNDQEGQKNELKPLQLEPSIKVVSPSVDFTPAKFITLLFTDLGVLTPSAVSEELIKLYQ